MTQDSTRPVPTPDLSRLFSPRAIAVVGATETPNAIGEMPVRFLVDNGYAGQVYPVNPGRDKVKGLTCLPSVNDLPGGVDLVVIAVAARHVPEVLRDAGRRGIPFALVLTAGFGESGPGAELGAELRRIVQETGIRIVGPNCLGLLNVPEKIHCGFGAGIGERNYATWPVAMVTQSGGYGFVIVKNAQREGMGFHYIASIGNSLDLNALDFIAWFLEDPAIKVVSAFIEGVEDGRRLLSLGRRALELGKPILVWKAGTTRVGQMAAATHTASLAAGYPLYRAAFREGGFIELRDYEDFLDITRAFLAGIEPAGRRIAIATGSGGAGVVAADRFEEAGLDLPPLNSETVARLRAFLPAFSVAANPVDITAQTSPDGSSVSNRAADALLSDPGIDMVMVRSGQTTGNAARAAEICDIRDRHNKPVLVTMSAHASDAAKAVFAARKLPWQPTVTRCAPVARALATFAESRRNLTRSRPPVRHFSPRAIVWPEGTGPFLSELDSRRILDAYGIPAMTVRHLDEDALDETVTGMAFPLAVKANSARIPHKTEADAIRLGVARDEMAAAARTVIANARAHDPYAEIDGVLLQEMAGGLELILGARFDRCFGPVVMFGLGGIHAEVLNDVVHGFAPFGPEKARALIGSIKGALLLEGYRGQPAADLDALAELLSRLSWLMADHAEIIDSIDINPVFVDGSRITVADALIALVNDR